MSGPQSGAGDGDGVPQDPVAGSAAGSVPGSFTARPGLSPVPTPLRVAYGLGSMAEGTKDTLFNIFLLFYYHSVLGLSGALAGLAIFLALCLDAVTDPLLGAISDRTRSRWGRRHPWMYASVVPLALAFVALAAPLEGLSQAALFGWLLGFAVLARQGMTLYAVPSNAMLPELTPHYDERTEIVGLRFLFGWLAGLSVAVLGYTVFFAEQPGGVDGRLDPAAWPAFGLFCAGVAVAGVLICAGGTHRAIGRLATPPAGPLRPRALLGDVREVLGSKPFRPLLWAALCSAAGWGYINATSLYINTWYWGLSSQAIGGLTLGIFVSVFIAAGAAPGLAAMSDKRTVAVKLSLFALVFGPLPLLLRLLGWFPENGTRELFAALLLHTIILFAALIAISIITASMIADLADWSEATHGRRHEGVFAAVMAFVIKATSGLGTLGAGLMLELIGLEASTAALQGAGEPAGAPATTALNALGGAVALGISLLFALSVWFLSRYPLTRERFAAVRPQAESA